MMYETRMAAPNHHIRVNEEKSVGAMVANI